MEKWKGVLFTFLLSMFLSGCSLHLSSSEISAPSKAANADVQGVDYNSARIIQLASSKAILVDGTYYELTQKSLLTNATGSALQPEELNPGDLVFLTASKERNGQFPGKGLLLSLLRHEDEKSKTISKAIAHVLENQKIGDIIAPEIKSISSYLVTLQFKDRANEHKYECIVNMKSLEFHIREISNFPKK